MFRIITDPKEAADFGMAGLLWWVSRADGGQNEMVLTCPFGALYGAGAKYIADNAHRCLFGVQVDE